MPETNTIGEQVLEAVVAGPDGANRLFTVTGAANVQILASGNTDPVNPTWTFLVGPTLTHGQFYRAIGSASVASQEVATRGEASESMARSKSAEEHWREASSSAEGRAEISTGRTNPRTTH